MKTLVLGIGNLLLQDEGAGVRAVERFSQDYRVPEGVEVLDGGTSGIELLQHVQGRELLIIIDVVKGGARPGTVFRIEGEDVPALLQKKISPHQLGLSDLLASARLTDRLPSRVVLLGIEPKSVETGLELSAEVDRRLPLLSRMIAAELRTSGFTMQPRPPAEPVSPAVTLQRPLWQAVESDESFCR